jgi:DNA repair exonuclease SbcCD ATPase subunit
MCSFRNLVLTANNFIKNEHCYSEMINSCKLIENDLATAYSSAHPNLIKLLLQINDTERLNEINFFLLLLKFIMAGGKLQKINYQEKRLREECELNLEKCLQNNEFICKDIIGEDDRLTNCLSRNIELEQTISTLVEEKDILSHKIAQFPSDSTIQRLEQDLVSCQNELKLMKRTVESQLNGLEQDTDILTLQYVNELQQEHGCSLKSFIDRLQKEITITNVLKQENENMKLQMTYIRDENEKYKYKIGQLESQIDLDRQLCQDKINKCHALLESTQNIENECGAPIQTVVSNLQNDVSRLNQIIESNQSNSLQIANNVLKQENENMKLQMAYFQDETKSLSEKCNEKVHNAESNFRNELEKYKFKINQLESQIDQDRQLCQEKINKCHALLEITKKIENQCAAPIQTVVSNLQNDVSRLKQIIETNESNSETISNQNSELLSALSGLRGSYDEIKRQYQLLEQSNEDLTREFDELSDKLAKCKKEKTKTDHMNSSQSAEIMSLQTELHEMKQMLEEAWKEKNNAKALILKNRHLFDSKQDNPELNSVFTDLVQKVSECEKQNLQHISNAKYQDLKIQQQEKYINDITNEMTLCNDNLKEFEKCKLALSSKLAKEQKLLSSKRKLNQTVNELETKIKSLTTDLEKCNSSLRNKSIMLQNLISERDGFKTQLQTTLESFKSITHERDGLIDKINNQNTSISTCQEKVDQLTLKLSELQRISEAQERNEKLLKYNNLQMQEQLGQRLQEIETHTIPALVNDIQTENKAFQDENRRIKLLLDQCGSPEDIQYLREKVTELENIIESRIQEINDLTTELNKTKDENKDFDRKLTQCIQKYNKLIRTRNESPTRKN